MKLVLRGSLRDPAARNVVVSAVRVTDDLSIARIYVRVLDEIGPDRQDAVVGALERASGFVRRELGRQLQLKHVPSLEFYWDDVVDSALRIEAILDEIDTDAPKSPGESS